MKAKDFPEFCQDLQLFSEKSLKWCMDESEQASNKIVHAINLLLEDTERVSALSEESLKAMQAFQSDFVLKVEERDQKQFQKDVHELVLSLEKLCQDHDEVSRMIQPILEALQFQDRLQQNLSNLYKMLVHWLSYREKLKAQGAFDDSSEQEFAQLLYGATTMAEERDLVAAQFPKGQRPKEGASLSEIKLF